MQALVVNIHYDNRNEESGIVDTSGSFVHATRTLRKYELGFLEIGPSIDLFTPIPPGVDNAFDLSVCRIHGQEGKRALPEDENLKNDPSYPPLELCELSSLLLTRSRNLRPLLFRCDGVHCRCECNRKRLSSPCA